MPYVIVNDKPSDGKKDVVHYVSKFGGFVKSFFLPKKAQNTEEPKEDAKRNAEEFIVSGTEVFEDSSVSQEEVVLASFGHVYANEVARKGIKNGSYSVGSIFVREKLRTKTSAEPQKIIAMVKREKGFSTPTNDWEFLAFDGKVDQPELRETIGNCATCHSEAKNTDWIYTAKIK